MNLNDYLAGLAAAQTAEELETAIQADRTHPFRGPKWTRICKVRGEAARRICDAHPLGRFVPSRGPRRQLTLCDENYRVASGGNSTGVRYAWHSAREWAVDVLRRNGFSLRAAHRLWDAWGDGYEHRCLAIVKAALEGKIPDPSLNTLIKHEGREWGQPLSYTVAQNEADKFDRRATRPCACGGTLFDWGASWSEGFDFVNWHCNGCPNVFTEYLPVGGLAKLRQRRRAPVCTVAV